MRDIYEILNLDDITYEIPEDAQPEIKQAMERFNNLPIEERRKTVPLYWLLGSGTPAYKMKRDVAEYVDESEIEGKTCGNCRFIWIDGNDKDIICSQIEGKIKKSGYCKLWVPSENNSQ